MNTSSIIKNSLYNVVYKGFTVIFPLLTSVYTSHVLLAEGVGKVSYANTIAGYFAILAALGIPNYGIKAISQNNDTLEVRSQVFWELLFINAISTSTCVLIYYSLVNTNSFFYGKRDLLNVSGLIIVLNYCNIDWLFQGIENYKYIALRGTIIRIVSLLLVVIFVKDKNDYLIYALLLCIATAGNYFVNFLNLRKHIVFSHKRLNLRRHLKSIIILLGSTIATEIYTMLDTVMIDFFYGDRYVGLYTNAARLVRVIYSICMAFVATFYPRLSYYIKNDLKNEYNTLLSRGMQIILVLVLPSILGIVILSKDIVLVLFGKSFVDASITLKILSILIIIFSFAYLLGHIFLISLGAEMQILKATIIGAIVNMILNAFLIPLYKHNGAAISSVISEMIVTYNMVNYAKNHFQIELKKKDLYSEVISLILMGMGILLLRPFFNTPLIRLLVIIPCAMMVYTGTLILTRHGIVSEISLFLHR